ncbi:hypothetical protein [Sandarakinorhabdus sp. DWP1-3-1]|uniref:hypothetical protein n=1 Tax=Sandarakinorhabdus sp. DWP1-3-1 TaxID=2804627 RepID=UPI003CF364D9
MNRRWLAAPAQATAATMIALLLIAAAPLAPADIETQLRGAAALYDSGKAADALPILDALLAQAELPADRGRIQQLRFFVLARMDKIPEARAAIEVAVANTATPTPALLAALFKIRAFMGDTDAAAETLLLVAATDAAALNTLPSELVSNVMRAVGKDKNRAFDLDFALNAAGWQPTDATLGDVDWLRVRLVAALVARDRSGEARAVIDAILNPVHLVRIGIDRRYQMFWPQVEKRLGPGADVADAAYLAATKARFDAAPTSLIARLGYAEALNVASREPEAMALADVAKTPAELAALTEREIWLVNLHASLLADAGQIDAALARLAALNASPLAGRPALVNTMINQALLAASVDRPQEALAAADAVDAKKGMISSFGALFIATARACALSQLGKASEAAIVAAPLVSKPDANDDAYLGAMICLGRNDAAAAAIIRRLAGEATRTDMLFNLQPFLINRDDTVRDVKERAALRGLKARPDVKAAYLKAGRDMPAAVAPPR